MKLRSSICFVLLAVACLVTQGCRGGKDELMKRVRMEIVDLAEIDL